MLISAVGTRGRRLLCCVEAVLSPCL